MRILYGVVGEGMGHAMRSRVVLDELVKHHDVQVVVSGRAYDYLKQRASESLAVKKIWGYSIVYEDNEVQNFKTLLANVKGAVKGWPQNVRAYFELAEKFQPDVVICDFESWSYLFAKNHRLPVLSLDNMQIINRCTHAPEILEGLGAEFQLTKAFVKAKVAGAAHYFITTFFYPPMRKPDTTLHPPILRPEILAARPARASTCSSTRRRPRTTRCRRSWRARGWSAASTGCAATSRRRCARGTCATARSARPGSSTICGRRAG